MHITPSYSILYAPARVSCTINLTESDKNKENSSQKTPQKIVALIKENVNITTYEMANLIGIDRSNIARAIKKLQAEGTIRRVGPDKGGHWEITSDQ